MTARDIAKFAISNLDERVDAASLARFLNLTSSASRSSVRVQLDPHTEQCTGRGLVSVPESRAKQLLAYNGRNLLGQPIVIYPEGEGSTGHRTMDSSARRSKPPGNNTRADFLSRHVKSEPAIKSEHVTNGSNGKVDSPVRKIKSETSEGSTRQKTSPRYVKDEPDTDSGRTHTRRSPRHITHEAAISANMPKVDPLSKFFKIEREGESDRSRSSGSKSYKSSVSVKTETMASKSEVKTETTTLKSEGVSAGTTTSRSGDGATSGSRSGNVAASGSRSGNVAASWSRSVNGATSGSRSGNGVTYGSRSGNGVTSRSRSGDGAMSRSGDGATSMSRSGYVATSGSRSGDGAEVSTWVNNGAAQSRRPYRLVDISANLTHRKYMEDLSQVIQRSKAAGVQKVVVTPLNLRGSEEALKLCKEYPGYIYCTVGVHPHEAKLWRLSTFDRLEYLARQPGCVAIGECGLDFNRDFSPRDQQLDVFEKQVQLACKVQKPLLLHEREAHEAFLKILNKYQADLPAVVCHCFTGRRNEALKYLSMGFYIGITGYLWKDTSSDGLRSLLYDDEIPVDKILLETDSPFMYPFIGRGRFPQHALDCVSPGSRQFLDCCGYQRNEPCAMPVITELVAGCMRRSPSELAEITTKNALTFFNLPM